MTASDNHPPLGAHPTWHPWPQLPRHATVVAAVVGFHVVGLYALQSGLLRRAVEVVVPVEVLAQLIAPPVPQVVVPPPPPPPKPKVVPTPRTPPAKAPPLPPPPQPMAVASSAPSPLAVTGALAPQPPAPTLAAPVDMTAKSPAPPAAPPPPRIDLPSSNADYINNRPLPYPALSKRLGEQGKVVVRVFIGLDGVASQAELRNSSGYDRLDQTALKTVLAWQYVPGKVNGEPKAMWFNVPIHFKLVP